MLIRILTSPVVSLFWTSIVLLVSVNCATKTGESSWVSRAGAMVTLAGLLLTTRSLLRYRVDESFLSRTVIDGGTAGDPDEKRQQLEISKDIVAERSGLWFMVLGTICWAYRDVIFDLLRTSVG